MNRPPSSFSMLLSRHTRRREFIALLGGAALPAVVPFKARAQQTRPVVGFLNAASPEANVERLRAFRQGLKDNGYVEGENVTIEYRWADGDNQRLPELAAELVRRRVDVIAAPGTTPAALAAKAATTTIPTVFAVGEDPLRIGLVASLARPAGNLTGINIFNAEVVGKRVELLRQILPGATRLAVLVNPSDVRTTEANLTQVEAAARAMRLQIQVLRASTSIQIDAAFAEFSRDRPDALFVAGDSFFNSRRLQLTMLAARYAIPASYGSRDYPEFGGLMSYGSNLTEAFRQAGGYTGRILKGASPAELPVVQATKFELFINHQTARMLSIPVPATLLAQADTVIE